MIELPLKKFGSQEIEDFKSIDLHDVYGDEFVSKRTFDSNLAERICLNLFYGLRETKYPHKFRGDFIYENYKNWDIKYYDQKTAKVVRRFHRGINGPFFNVKYSNVASKMFVQLVFRELDLIISDLKNVVKWDIFEYSRLISIRFKGEITFDDMLYIDNIIDTVYAFSKTDFVPKSFCIINRMYFLHFVNYLGSHNVRRHSNLLIFHEPLNFEQTKKWDVIVEGNQTRYKTYHKQTNYIVTPIDVKKVNIYVDYIGFGGFKVDIPPIEHTDEQICKPVDEIMGHIQELDEAINVVDALSNYKDYVGYVPWKQNDYGWSSDEDKEKFMRYYDKSANG